MQAENKCAMLTHFPRFFSFRAIICYVVTLALVSSFFIRFAMPFQFVLFGLTFVIVFFTYSNKLSIKWYKLPTRTYTKKLFISALIIRIIYVIFIYFYYIEMTGEPHGYHAGDELSYQYWGSIWRENGFAQMADTMSQIYFSDRGYPWWLGFEYLLLGTHVLPARIVKCIISAFSCVLMYNLAKRNFGEAAGRITGIFCMLMPSMWFYCGITLKECEMAFMTILFVERADLAFRSPKLSLGSLILPGVIILIMFTFRTALAGVLVAALLAALIMSSGKQLQTWKKILYSLLFAVWMFLTVGAEMVEETQMLWEGRESNQIEGYQERSSRSGGNAFARYATASVFAPLIFTIPFTTMVKVDMQETQMLLTGAFFIKTVLSGLTIFALRLLLVRGDWRKHVLSIAVTAGYLVVLVFSNFAHSERFHFPVLALELMFAAYGVSQLTNKHKRWYVIWLVGICIANIVWNWIKLAGRGFAV